MFDNRQKRFAFLSGAVGPETFEVVKFKGHEGLSRLYRFEITLASENEEIDLKAMVGHPAALVMLHGDRDYPIHGVLSSFEQDRKVNKYTYYRAILTPRVWTADRYLESQLFIDKSVPDIIREIFRQAGVSALNYELRLNGSYPTWEYICQHRETDFDFISRWMEREGIYYYFEQGESCEKMIITDTLNVHVPIKGPARIDYHQVSGLVPAEEETVFSLTCAYNSRPQKVVLRDYNYRKPGLDLTCEAVVDPDGRGESYTYGEHYKTPEEGKALAKIRAQELLCNERVFAGESTAPAFAPGFLFELTGHYRPDFDQKYLITDIKHEGYQNGYQFSDPNSGQKPGTPDYTNVFTAIAADVQYRPPRNTERPRISGAMNATVDSQGSGQYAEIDELGRYKVRLPFDMDPKNNMKASRWVRMAQHYAGPDYGSHFPLHKGAEVALSFIDGDPDRPYITAAIPNPDTLSPITAANLTKSMIRSASGNEYHLDDRQGSENIYTHAVRDQTTDVVNDRTKTVGHDETMRVGNNRFKTVGANQSEEIGADKTITVGANHTESVAKDMALTVGANRTTTIAADHNVQVGANASQTIGGNSNVQVAGASDEKVGSSRSVTIGAAKTETVGLASIETVGAVKMLSVGGAYQVSVGAAKNTTVAGGSFEQVGFTKKIDAGKTIELVCGSGKIVVDKSGNITVEGVNVKVNASGPVKVRGAIIDCN